MSARIYAALALLAVYLFVFGGVAVMTNASLRRRTILKEAHDATYAPDRYVDVGVTLCRVVADPDGIEFVDGCPKMRIIGDPVDVGGMLDTALTPPAIAEGHGSQSWWVGPFDQKPPPGTRVWFCSEDQWNVIWHVDEAPVGMLALGGMGAGKTTAGVMWTFLRWLEHIGENREGGITAPVEKRLFLLLDEINKLWSPSWFRFSTATNIMTMCDGTRLRFVSTKRQSAAQGSPIQGFNWSWWLGDELQDQINEYVNIQARLRSARYGRGKRLGTATAKDDPNWRTFREGLDRSGLWACRSMIGTDSPFMHPAHWDALAKSMTENEYKRFVLAEDLPSESRLYSAFDRKENVCPIPIGARKITSIVLSRKTGDKRDALAMGHDPGVAKAGTVWADAYEIPTRKGEVLWWVRAELFTLHETHEQHATKAMAITRDRFGCNQRADAERAHVRCQPLGVAEDKPDLDVFAVWKRVGFDIRAAQYSKNGSGFGHIKKESRIGVVNTLFCNAQQKRRLFIECDDRGQCVAPQLVSALETMERDHLGRPEHEDKNVKKDKSDLPAALGYLLWPFEKELAVALRADIQRGMA